MPSNRGGSNKDLHDWSPLVFDNEVEDIEERSRSTVVGGTTVSSQDSMDNAGVVDVSVFGSIGVPLLGGTTVGSPMGEGMNFIKLSYMQG